ncbi:MAG: DUF411 domain-containing protein [Acidobacteriota bacterium]
MNRQQFLWTLLATSLVATVRLRASGSNSVKVYKTPTCGCCGKWVKHLRENGFQVEVLDVEDTAPYRRKFGIPDQLMSCHTAIVDAYAVEGHVPASEIRRLLRERPSARGLAVPGMPVGSPGMESKRSDSYSVMLVNADGRSTVSGGIRAGSRTLLSEQFGQRFVPSGKLARTMFCVSPVGVKYLKSNETRALFPGSKSVGCEPSAPDGITT